LCFFHFVDCHVTISLSLLSIYCSLLVFSDKRRLTIIPTPLPPINHQSTQHITLTLLLTLQVPPAEFDDHFGVLLYTVMISLALVFARKHLLDLVLSRLLMRSVNQVQVDALAVCVWCAFVSSLLYVVYLMPLPPAPGTTAGALRVRKNTLVRRVQAVLLMVAGMAGLLALEAFGPVLIRLDPTSSTYLVIESHPEMRGQRTDQSGLFLLVTAMMGLLGAADVIPVRHSAMGANLFFCLTSYSAAQFLLWFLFPHSLGKDDVSYGLFALPSIYCYTLAAGATAITMAVSLAQLSAARLRKTGSMWTLLATEGSSSSSHRNASRAISVGGGGSPVQALAAVFVAVPVPALCYCYLTGQVHLYRMGIMWGGAVTSVVLAVVLRLVSMVNEVQAMRASAASSSSSSSVGGGGGGDGLASTASSLCALSACLAVVWTAFVTAVSPVGHVDADFTVPLVSLVMLTTRKGVVVDRTHGLAVAGAIACLWWFMLSLCVFILIYY
jgi:hypothetical protein